MTVLSLADKRSIYCRDIKSMRACEKRIANKDTACMPLVRVSPWYTGGIALMLKQSTADGSEIFYFLFQKLLRYIQIFCHAAKAHKSIRSLAE